MRCRRGGSVSRSRRFGGVAEQREGEDPGEHHREHVRQEQQEGPEGEAERALAQAHADDRERRDQRDRDGDARQHGGHVRGAPAPRLRRTRWRWRRSGPAARGRCDPRSGCWRAGRSRRARRASPARRSPPPATRRWTTYSREALRLPLGDSEGDPHDRGRQRGDDHRADDRRRVESVITPAVAMAPSESVSIVQNAESLERDVAAAQVEVLGQLLERAAPLLGDRTAVLMPCGMPQDRPHLGDAPDPVGGCLPGQCLSRAASSAAAIGSSTPWNFW